MKWSLQPACTAGMAWHGSSREKRRPPAAIIERSGEAGGRSVQFSSVSEARHSSACEGDESQHCDCCERAGRAHMARHDAKVPHQFGRKERKKHACGGWIEHPSLLC